MKSAVVLLSGGLDSSTLLAYLQHHGYDPLHALIVNYGQRHDREMDAAIAIAEHYNVPYADVHFASFGMLLKSSSQTNVDVDVPEGHYQAENMKTTVVPNRNMFFLSIAGAYAIEHGLDAVAIAAHAGDHAIYADCRREFYLAMNEAFVLCHDPKGPFIAAPFIDQHKSWIGQTAKDLGVPIELTWSCYKGGELHCGKCGTCVERKEALNGFDPTEYES